MSEQNPTYDELFSENKKLKTLLLKNNQSDKTRLSSELEIASINKLIDDSNVLKKLAIDGAKAGTIVLDIIKDELIWDKRSLEIFGTDEESFGKNFESWAKFVHEDDLKEILSEVDKQLKSGKILDLRYRIIRPDGEIRHIWANASIIRNDKGEAIGLSGLHFDETELVLSKMELENFNKVMIDREMRIIEMKEEVNKLSEQIGIDPPYPPIWKNGE